MNYTKKQFDILLYLRKKPRKLNRLKKKFAPASDDVWNIWLSGLNNLYYVLPEGSKVLDAETIVLNDIGETIAQAEHDRRFDMYFTRAMALAALLTSLLAIGIDVIRSKQEAPQPQCQCTTISRECDHGRDHIHPHQKQYSSEVFQVSEPSIQSPAQP